MRSEKHSVFERCLGEQSYNDMPLALRLFHSVSAPNVWTGKSTVRTGSWAAKIIAKIFGFPAAGDNIPLTVTVDHELDKQGQLQERWTRTFGKSSFFSILKLTADDRLIETFWPFTFNLDISADEQQLTMPVSGWRMGSIPLPKFLAPVSETKEFQDEQGRFRFDVKLSHPLIGLIAHYQGWLVERA